MAGVKGRSGRKSKRYEKEYEFLEGLCVSRAIAYMSLDTSEMIKSGKLTILEASSIEKKKQEIMMAVIDKGFPQTLKLKAEGLGDTHYHVTVFRDGTKDLPESEARPVHIQRG